MKNFVALFLLLNAVTVLFGCTPVPTVPSNNTADTTPALLKLGTAGLQKDLLVDQSSTAAESRHAQRADEVLFVATAEDSESGIKSITLDISVNVNCKDVGTSQVFSETLNAPVSSNRLPTQLTKSFTFKVATYRARCSRDRAVISLNIRASSENGAGAFTQLQPAGLKAVDPLKVATFNLHAPGNHPQSDQQRWGEQLGAMADVWVLTEVKSLTEAQFIANAAGMPHVKMHPGGDIAIASRTPLYGEQIRTIDPPGNLTSGLSNILSVTTTIDGVAHQIIGTHWGIRGAADRQLCACESDLHRLQAAQAILDFTNASTAPAKFVAGDMNAYSGFGPQDHDGDSNTPDFVGSTTEVDLLRSLFVDPFVFLNKDNSSVCSNQRIDYVMAKGAYRPTDYNANFCNAASPSDHPFVIATFEAFDP